MASDMSKCAETEVNILTKQCTMRHDIKPQPRFQNWTATKTPKIPFQATIEKTYAYMCCKIKSTIDRYIMEVSRNICMPHEDQNINQYL